MPKEFKGLSRFVSSPAKHIHNYKTRLNSNLEDTIGSSSSTNNPNPQVTYTALETTTMVHENETGAGQTQPQDTNNMARSSNLHLMNTDRFNGVSGIEIGDYISNIEAEVRANRTPEHLIEDQCIKLTRTRLDTTKSAFLKNVARLIDLRPANEKTWALV